MGGLPNQLANLLTGLGVDEIFSHTDASGVRHLLTSYSYEPYGNKATVSGH